MGEEQASAVELLARVPLLSGLEPSELERDSGSWGRAAGQAGVLTARSQNQSFTAYAVSGSGRSVYVVTHDGARVSRRVCRHGSVPRLERDGCDEPGW